MLILGKTPIFSLRCSQRLAHNQCIVTDGSKAEPRSSQVVYCSQLHIEKSPTKDVSMAARDVFGGMESFGYWCIQNSPRVSYRPSPSYHSLNPDELHPREQGPWLDKILESPTTLDPSECAAGLVLEAPSAQPGPQCLLEFPHTPAIIMPPPLDTINYPPLGSGEIPRPEPSQKVKAAEQERKLSFRTLPYEVKVLIMKELDTESPISSRVERDPETIIDKSGRIIGDDVTHDLKNASLVSKEWRSMAFRCLFRYIKWTPRID